MNALNVLKLVFSLVLLAGMLQCTYAQKYTLKEADKFYGNYHFASSIPLYESWLKTHPVDVDVKERLANAYVKINDSHNGERLYAQLMNNGVTENKFLIAYAEMLMMNGNYNKALEMYQLYKEKGGDTRGERFTEGLKNITDFYRDSTNVKIEFLSINSSQEDFAPAFYKQGLVFCSAQVPPHGLKHTFNWNHGAYLDLYIIDDTSFVHSNHYASNLSGKTKAKHIYKDVHSDHTFKTSNDTHTLGYYKKAVYDDTLAMNHPVLRELDKKINTKYHEGPVVFFEGEESFIFTRNNFHRGKYNTDKEGTNRLKLFIATRDGDSWDENNFPYNSDEYSVGHPALSPDNNVLYFTSDMRGGKGGTDIWYCKLVDNQWSTPINLVSVNTEGQEMFPFVDKHGNLFFASNGWAGIGGLDIFYSQWKDPNFSMPVNVGFPINSMKDDFGLIVGKNDRSGYFSSSRNMEATGDDIYYFKSKIDLIKSYSISGVVKNDKSNELLSAVTVVLTDDKGNQLNKMITNKEASFAFSVEPGKTYSLSAEKLDYLPFTAKIATTGIKPGQPDQHDVLLSEKGVYSMACTITDRKTGALLDSVMITLTDPATSKEIFSQKQPGKGELYIVMKEVKKGDACNLLVQVTRKGYLSKAVRYNDFYKEPGVLKLHEVMDMNMDKIDLGTDIGKLVKVNPIYFDLGKSVIRADAAKELSKIVDVMYENPGMKIELGSHTDSRGSDASNLSLSDKRAKASVAYIVSKGISQDRITAKGYGESRLVNTCNNGVKCSENDHQLNRRTEFVIVSLE